MEKQNNETEKVKDKPEFENLQALIEATDKENPKPEDLSAMQKYLNDNAAFVTVNSISRKAFERAVEVSSSSALMREMFNRQIKEKRKDLGIEAASPVEKILIDQVVLCWFRLNNLEILHAVKTHEGHSVETGLYWEKRLNSAQRRLLKATETLTKVQKHLSEANLREQQARNSRGKSAILANKLLKDLSN